MMAEAYRATATGDSYNKHGFKNSIKFSHYVEYMIACSSTGTGT